MTAPVVPFPSFCRPGAPAVARPIAVSEINKLIFIAHNKLINIVYLRLTFMN
jgi:hypothetical protein